VSGRPAATTRRLDPADVRAAAERGELALVDLRPPGAFASGHPAGAVNVPYSPRRLAERVATVLPDGIAVAVTPTDEPQAGDAARQLAAGGRAVAGVVAGDRAAWVAAGAGWETLEELTADDLAGDPASLTVVDVREPVEWETGHVPGALLLPLGSLPHHLDQLPHDRRLAVICESGSRSSTAASLLLARGFPAVANVPDGTAGYRRAGLPVAFPPPGPRQ
jgi:hydroxyacylglutathione hydrolase